MTCEEARLQLSAYLDGELSEPEAKRMEAHLNQCEDCSALLEAYKAIDEGVMDLTEPIPEGFAQRVMDNLPKQEKPKRRRFAYGGFTAVAAVAAVLVLAIAAGKLKLPNMGASSSSSDMFAYSTQAASEPAMQAAITEETAEETETMTAEQAAPAAMVPTAMPRQGDQDIPAASEPSGGSSAPETPALGAAPNAALFAAGPSADEPAEAYDEAAEEAADWVGASLYAARDAGEPSAAIAAQIGEAEMAEEAVDSDLNSGVFDAAVSMAAPAPEPEAEEAELAQPELAESVSTAANALVEAPAPIEDIVPEESVSQEAAIPDAPAPEPAPLPEPAAAMAITEEAEAEEPMLEPLPREDVFGTGQELILLGPSNLTREIIAQNTVVAALRITGASSGALPQVLAELAYQQLEDGCLYHEDDPETVLAIERALRDQLPSGMDMNLGRLYDVDGTAYILLIP